MANGAWKGGRTRAAAAVALLLLGLPAAALAATPKAGGHYKGTTGLPAVNGSKAPVTFSVSSAANRLERFKYGSLGCQGAGGFQPGVNPFTGRSLVNVGTVHVDAKGKFSVKGATTKESVSGAVTLTITTKTTVSGRFSSPSKATGTIKFTQHFAQSGVKPYSCSSPSIAFTAKLK
jgi:hypothetical protein